MLSKYTACDGGDKRISYAVKALDGLGYKRCDNSEDADFILLGVNPDKSLLRSDKPVFAGNVQGENIYDYTKDECFAIENAYLTAEGALALAIDESDQSLINSSVLITGYGRIAKALQRYLFPFTSNVTICARSSIQRSAAKANGSKVINFETLKDNLQYDFIFNTVPHPVFNDAELKAIRKSALLIDLASFPGGVDKHLARVRGIRLIEARGLPAKYSPKSAGEAVARAVDKINKEVIV